MKRLTILIPTLALSACGALFNGGPANVAMNSNPAGAEIWIDGTNRGITPATLQLEKGKNHTVTFRKAGHADTNYEITRQVSPTYVVLDVLGGLIPIIVDAATGSWYVLSTKEVNVQLAQQPVAQGQLTPEQLGAVRLGTPIAKFVDTSRILRAAALQQ
ncbi:MAG TPA: PEGA domain-containing protein [Longimicrobium sp.]